MAAAPPPPAAETIVFKLIMLDWAAKVTPSPSFHAHNIPVLVSNGRWWLFSSSSLQLHIDLMHFVAATIFTIHSQRVVRLGHLCENLNVQSRLDEC